MKRNSGAEMTVLHVWRFAGLGRGSNVPKCLKVFGLVPKCLNRSHQHEANSLPLRYRMTRHPRYRGDKLSCLAPPSELIKYHSPCGIRSLPEGGNMAPILQRRFH